MDNFNIEYDELEIWKDLEIFKKKNFNKSIEAIYNNFPETECNNCGDCCYDSPILTYAEFLFAFDCFLQIGLSRSDIIDLYKDIFKNHFLGLVQQVKCSFNINNRCLIHKASPYCCKRWGLQSEEDYLRDLNENHDFNADLHDYYLSVGITIPDEVINRKTTYCHNVKIIKKKRNLTSEHLEKLYQEIALITEYFGGKNRFNLNICQYMLAIFFNEKRTFFDRIRTIKAYQNGDAMAVDNYIKNIDFNAKLNSLFSYLAI